MVAIVLQVAVRGHESIPSEPTHQKAMTMMKKLSVLKASELHYSRITLNEAIVQEEATSKVVDTNPASRVATMAVPNRVAIVLVMEAKIMKVATSSAVDTNHASKVAIIPDTIIPKEKAVTNHAEAISLVSRAIINRAAAISSMAATTVAATSSVAVITIVVATSSVAATTTAVATSAQTTTPMLSIA